MFTIRKIHSVALTTAVMSVVSFGFGSSPLLAAEASTPVPSVTVKFGDLNLTSTEGVRVLYRRLEKASRQVCRDYDGRDLATKMRYRACYDQALSVAVGKVHLETLTAMYKKATAHQLS